MSINPKDSKWRKAIEELLKSAKSADHGWPGQGWTQLDSYTGTKGACSVWMDERYPERYAIKVWFYEGTFSNDKPFRELLCCGKVHALEVYEWTRKAMDEEEANA